MNKPEEDRDQMPFIRIGTAHEQENKEELNAAAKDAFNQAQDGLAVPLDPEMAEGMGAFTEQALTLQDVLDAPLLTAEGEEDGQG